MLILKVTEFSSEIMFDSYSGFSISIKGFTNIDVWFVSQNFQG